MWYVMESRSSKTKDYQIVICCFSAKYAALRSKSKDLLAQNHDNVSEWSNMSTRGVLFQNHDNVSEWSDMSTRGVLFQNHDNVSEWSDMSTHGVLFQNHDNV
jgi:hypothetical protein